MLQYIIPSKARRKILTLFFHNQSEQYYLRKIVREVKEEVNAVKRELDILYEGKVVTKEKRLNKIFYHLNKNYVFYDEFVRIFTKTLPISELLYKNLSKIGKVKYIALSKKFVRGEQISPEDVAVLFVGVIVIPEVESIMKEVESYSRQQINYTVMTEEEVNFRKKNNDPFLWRFLRMPKIMLVGQEEELMK